MLSNPVTFYTQPQKDVQKDVTQKHFIDRKKVTTYEIPRVETLKDLF
jgi:hypothetical protein